MLSIITLVASGVLCYGISDIYKTKTNPEEKKSIAKGVSATILGLAGIAFANPVFDSFLLSAIVAVTYVAFLTGFISHTFLKQRRMRNLNRIFYSFLVNDYILVC